MVLYFLLMLYCAFLIIAFLTGGLRGGVRFCLLSSLSSFMFGMLVQDGKGSKCALKSRQPLAFPRSIAFPGNVQVLFV